MRQLFRLTGLEADSLFDQIADIHQEEIHEGNLSTLGAKFLKRLYRTLASGPHSFVYAYKEDDSVLGFICGALDTGLVYKDFMQRAGFFALLVLMPRLLSVSRLKRILETMLYPSKQGGDDLPSAEILNFCVRSTYQGQKIGSRLFGTLCDEFRTRGVESIRIVTGERQESARRFYESKGAILVRPIEVHKGTRSLLYVYKVTN